MDATRARLGSFLEWILATAGIVAVFAIGSMVVREFRTASAVTPVIAREAPRADPPASVPPGAVSIPVLPLPDGTAVRVGDDASQVAARVGRQYEVGLPSVDRTPTGERVTRFYQEGGRRFIVVTGPLASGGEARVTAIYLQ